MKDYPLISIVIVTHNSQRTLEKSLQSIARQNYPKNKIETLIVDGRSKDDTLKIAKKYKCKIIDNPKILLIHGKQIGYLKSKGKYMLSLDSDEVLANPDSLRLRIETFKKNPQVRTVMASGLRTPNDYSPINHYINNFGDPFSYFVYRLSHNPDFYVNKLSRIGTVVVDDKDCLIVNFPVKSNLPIIEPTGAGGIIDLAYCKQHLPDLKDNPDLIIHVFYLLNQKGMFLGVTKNDPIIHYSAGSIQTYLRKISAKVKNNIFQTTMAEGGFLGREKIVVNNWRKYLFIPYSFSIILPFFESLSFVWTRKNFIFLIHPILCLYTSIVVIFWFVMKALGYKPGFINY